MSKQSLVVRARDAMRSYWRGPMSARDPELAKWFNTSAQISSGINVTESNALSYSAVFAGVSLISGQLGNLPLVLQKRLPNGGKERYDAHPLYRLLHDRPNPEMSSMVFRETLQAHVLTYGNAYAEIQRNGGNQPIALWPMTPDRVRPYRDHGVLKYHVAEPGGGDVVLDAMDTLHIPGLGFDGISGYGVIDKMRESIGLGLATERFGGSFFGNGTTFGGVFEHPTKLSEIARKNFTESINARHQGVDRAHKFMVVEEGMKYQRFGIDPNAAQFLETRTFQVDEVARWLNLPPHKLKNLVRSTNNNIEHQNLEYYIDCLSPWCNRWEQELEYKLIAASERNLQAIEHIVEGLLRGDSAGRGEFHSKQFSVASISPNEVRKSENRNPIAGGEMPFAPLNMIPLDMVRPYWEAEITAKKQPKVAPAAPADAEKQRQIDALIEERDLARRVAQETEDAADVARTESAAAQAASAVEVAHLHSEALRLGADLGQAVSGLSAMTTRAQMIEADYQRVCGEKQVADAVVVELRAQVGTLTADVQAGVADMVATRIELARVQIQGDERAAELATAAERAAATVVDVQTLQQRLTDTSIAARAAVVDRVSWLLERESDRARRVQASPDKLRKWLDQFYVDDYADLCRQILRPSVRALAICLHRPEPVEQLLDVLVAHHLQQSTAPLRALADDTDTETLAPSLEKVLRRWSSGRADATLDAVLQLAIERREDAVVVPPASVPQIHIHNHPPAANKSVTFIRNPDGSVRSAQIEDE